MMVPSAIFADVTALFDIVKAPVLSIVASPLSVPLTGVPAFPYII